LLTDFDKILGVGLYWLRKKMIRFCLNFPGKHWFFPKGSKFSIDKLEMGDITAEPPNLA